jgi:histidinol dehydrogenase
MIEIITQDRPDLVNDRLARIRTREIASDSALTAMVAGIIEDVRKRGDAALVEYTRKFDGVELSVDTLRISEEDLRRSASRVGAEVLAALRESIRRVRVFHERQIEASWELETGEGIRLGQRITPIERVGLYVPGGTASYPSSVVMNAVPAQVAGVTQVAVVTPPRTLAENPAVAAALVELGIDEIYTIGGAHSVAALAYGTETIPRVDKITGPGNKYVAAAKRLVFGSVGIDSIAGPSEVVIIADASARADFVAADLIAQAEHAEDASSILITTDIKLAEQVRTEVQTQLFNLPRRTIASESIDNYGAIFVVADLSEACAIANQLAPEHLEIMTEDPDSLVPLIKHAGAIFLGLHTPEAVGDYFAGPNHVLPTGGSVRFASALGVYDFVRRTSILKFSKEELERTTDMIVALAKAEGLEAHARSTEIRRVVKKVSSCNTEIGANQNG